jgi:hypothetical protein
MTPNRFTDTLFQLIKSLQRGEKRHFKIFIKRNNNNNLKTLELFDAIEKLDEYDEEQLLKKLTSIKKPQIHNTKAYLYNQLLESLRILKSNESIDLQLTEQLDYAHILYKKGLFVQAEKIIEKVKEVANKHHKLNHVLHALAMEKRLEILHISRHKKSRALQLATESQIVAERLQTANSLSNLSMVTQNWFVTNGFCRTPQQQQVFLNFIQPLTPNCNLATLDFYGKMYWYQAQSLINFICLKHLQHYKNAQRLVNLFEQEPAMKRVETGNYIKALHSLLNNHFYLRNYNSFGAALSQLQNFYLSDRVQNHDNFRVQAYVYLSSARINYNLLTGNFKAGIALIPELQKTLKEDSLFIDSNRINVLNYKIALLYFGNGEADKSIKYLNNIINETNNLNTELVSYAKLLLLLAHFELGNFMLVKPLTQSVYRHMSGQKQLSKVEVAIMSFLKKSLQIPKHKLRAEQELLLTQIKALENNVEEARTFTYLDVSSWLESKIKRTTFENIIQQKIATRNNRKKTFLTKQPFN